MSQQGNSVVPEEGTMQSAPGNRIEESHGAHATFFFPSCNEDM
jgi:hypothetical protein